MQRGLNSDSKAWSPAVTFDGCRMHVRASAHCCRHCKLCGGSVAAAPTHHRVPRHQDTGAPLSVARRCSRAQAELAILRYTNKISSEAHKEVRGWL